MITIMRNPDFTHTQPRQTQSPTLSTWRVGHEQVGNGEDGWFCLDDCCIDPPVVGWGATGARTQHSARLSGFGRWCLHRHIRQHARHWPCGLWEIGSASTTIGKPWGSGDLVMRRSSSMCLGFGVWNDLQNLDVCFEDLIFGAFFSMAMTQEPIDWRYLPYIRPIFQAYVREYPTKYGLIWY